MNSRVNPAPAMKYPETCCFSMNSSTGRFYIKTELIHVIYERYHDSSPHRCNPPAGREDIWHGTRIPAGIVTPDMPETIAAVARNYTMGCFGKGVI